MSGVTLRRATIAAVLLLAGASAVLVLAGPAGGWEPADTDTAGFGLRWRRSDRRAYALRIDTKVRMVLSGAADATVEHSVEGTLHLRVCDVRPDVVRLGFQLSPARLSVDGVSDAEHSARLAAPFRAELAPNGRVRRFEFSDALAAHERALLEESIRVFQCVVPSAAEERWRTVERHGTGKYIAEYSRVGPNRCRKQKIEYRRPVDPAKPQTVEIGRSVAIFALSVRGSWLQSAQVVEELTPRIDAANETPSRLRATLRPADPEPAIALFREEWSFDGREAASARLEAAPAMAGPATAERAEASEADIEQVRAVLRALAAAEGKNLHLVHELRDLLLRFPELATEALALLALPEMSDGGLAAVLHAFELAGTPQSQVALCTLMDGRRRAYPTRLRAIVALAGLARPTPETLAKLWNRFRDRTSAESADLSNTAVLALGSLGDELRRSDPDAWAAQRDRILAVLRTAGNAETAATVLKAVANTRDGLLTSEAAHYLVAPAANVRAAAAQAVGALGGAGALDALTTRLAAETDARVRASLAAGLGKLDRASARTFSVVHAAARRERDEKARYALARYLGERLDEYPAARETLAEILQAARSTRTRKYLASLLYRKRNASKR